MRVSVTAGARLHLGFTNLSDDLGRCCGSLGVALDRPTTTVIVDDAGAPGHASAQVAECVRRFGEHFGVDPRVSVAVPESITPHVGLGSGTQLSLAVGHALAAACGVDADPWEIALAMGRCRRSGIGAATFLEGGFVIDAGHRTASAGQDARPTIVWRRDLPSDWRFVIAVPDATHGMNGSAEEGVFRELAPSVRTSEAICRITQLRLMPALVEEDIEEFGRALTDIDRKTGDYFSALQGGVYGDGGTRQVIEAMLAAGACGVGQSSWGPAVYGLVHAREAGRLEADVRRGLDARGVVATVFVSRGRNTGAVVDIAGEAL
jgi:beta-RFAP synthase